MSDSTDDVDWYDGSLEYRSAIKRGKIMNYHCDAVGPVKQGQRGEYFSVKCGQTWFFVEGGEEQRSLIQNKNFNATVRPSKNPKYNSWMAIVAIEDDKPAPKAEEAEAEAPTERRSNNGIPVNDWMSAMKEFHKLALELEPDELAKQFTDTEVAPIELVKTDRSVARAAILNTCMIALSNGKIDMADDIPF